MKKETILEVLRELIGNIEPVADASIDRKRMENLEKVVWITERLVFDLEYVARRNRSSMYGSSKELGKYAEKSLNTMFEEVNESLNSSN